MRLSIRLAVVSSKLEELILISSHNACLISPYTFIVTGLRALAFRTWILRSILAVCKFHAVDPLHLLAIVVLPCISTLPLAQHLSHVPPKMVGGSQEQFIPADGSHGQVHLLAWA